MVAACVRRIARHDEWLRSGAGCRPPSRSTFRTEVADTAMPKPLSSPTMRRYPQCGFSRPSRKISVRSDDSSGGRPQARCSYVQRRTISPRQLRLPSLPMKHLELMAQQQDLELLRATRPRQQPDEREQVPRGEIRRTTRASSTLRSTTARPLNLASRPREESPDEFANPTGTNRCGSTKAGDSPAFCLLPQAVAAFD